MRTTLYVLGTAALALVLHLTLGWAWTLGAGIVGGGGAVRRGWLVGALGVGLDWALLVLYNYVAAGGAVRVMTGTMGEMLGNMPGLVIVAATVLIGGLLGLLGGLIGTVLGRRRRPSAGAPIGA